jgi:hypothetical protein
MPLSILNEPTLGDILATATTTSSFGAEVLEKDLWVVWTLQALFGDPDLGRLLGFKGGTSLSKAYAAITRFSEDVDLTVDHRAFGDPFDPLAKRTPSKTQLRRWRERVESDHLPRFLLDRVLPRLTSAAEAGLDGPRRPVVTIDPADLATVRVMYPSVLTRATYLREAVLLEFGGRMTIEPVEHRAVRTYLQDDLPELATAYALPAATPQVIHGARTFWEKVTAVHAFITRDDAALKFAKADRLSRHWYDLVALRAHPLGVTALERRDLRDKVIQLKTLFFPAPDVDYADCGNGRAHLVPSGPLLDGLRLDYESMLAQGMFRSDDPPPPFPDLLDELRSLEHEINAMPTAVRGA